MPKELASAVSVLDRYGYKTEADAVRRLSGSADAAEQAIANATAAQDELRAVKAELNAAREQIARLTAPQA